MATNPRVPHIADLRVRLAAIAAELEELTADAADDRDQDQDAGEPHRETTEDAVAEVRRRYGRTRTEVEAERQAEAARQADEDTGRRDDLSGAAAGIAEARRRGHRRP